MTGFRHGFLALFGLAVLAAGGAGLPARAEEGGAETGAELAPVVTVFHAEMAEVRAEVPVTGTLVPREEVLVTPQLTGVQIRQVLVEAGDWVDAGDPLVILRSDLAEAQLSQAEAARTSADAAIRQAENQIASTAASLSQAEAELERYRTLRESGNVSQSAFDASYTRAEAARAAAASARDGLAIAQSQRAQADAQLEIARLNLSWTRINAPVSGLVGARNAEVGALTGGSGTPLLTIIAGGVIELSAEVIETALARMRPGQGGAVRLPGEPGELIALVRRVAPTVDPVTRLGDVRITLEGNPALRPGIFAAGSMVIDRHMALTVPVAAVLTDASGAYVQVVADGVVARRAVVPGLIWNDRREIVAGLSEGETVIARAGAFFRDGDHVRSAEAGAGQ